MNAKKGHIKTKLNLAACEGNADSVGMDIAKYSVFFLLIGTGCYLFFLISSVSLIKYSSENVDGLTQVIPSYVAIKHMIQALIAGDGFSQWSWSLGLGGDTFEYFGYKLANPFTYLIIAFPEDKIDLGYTIAAIAREYFAGITFILCMREVKMSSLQVLTGALSYAFCGWIIGTVLNQSSFDNAAIVLPLLIMGIDRFLRKNTSLLLVVAVFLCCTCGVIWTYISGIIAVAYYLIRYSDYHKGESLKGFAWVTARYCIHGIIALMIAAPFIISILCSMTGATTDTKSSFNSQLLFSPEKYLTLPEGLLRLKDVGAISYSLIFMSIICVALLPVMIAKLKERSSAAILATVLLVLSLFPATSSFFNGMSYPAGRWYYVLAFFVIWATISCLSAEVFSKKSNIIIMISWLILLLVWILGAAVMMGMPVSKRNLMTFVAVCMLGIGAIIILYLYYNINASKWGRRILAVSMMLALSWSIIIPVNLKVCPYLNDYIDGYLKYAQAQRIISTSPERVAAKLYERDSDFYRIDQGYRLNSQMSAKLKPNLNLIYDNRSNYIYSSIIDSKWSLYNKIVGNNYGYFARVAVMGDDNRPNLMLLHGIKYYLGSNEHEKNSNSYVPYGFEKSGQIDGVDIFKSKYNIGLGTTFSQYITQTELMKYPQVVRDQLMLQVAVLPDGTETKLKHAKADSIVTSYNTALVTFKNCQGAALNQINKTITVPGGNGKFKINFKKSKDTQIMLVFDGLRRDGYDYEEAVANGVIASEDVPANNLGRAIKSASYKDRGDFTIKADFGDITKYSYCEKNNTRGFNDIESYCMNLGYEHSDSGTIDITLKEAGVYRFDDIIVYEIPMDVYDNCAQTLEDNRYRLEEMSNDYIKGTVKTDSPSILYMSIPYDKGWKAYADGKEVKVTYNTDIAYTGVMLPSGKHVVEMRYSHWGMGYALIIALIGLVLMLALALTAKRLRACSA